MALDVIGQLALFLSQFLGQERWSEQRTAYERQQKREPATSFHVFSEVELSKVAFSVLPRGRRQI
jgi:hypothetical protein